MGLLGANECSQSTDRPTDEMADTALLGVSGESEYFVKTLTWEGATSGMMANGMGPNPMANDLPKLTSVSCRGSGHKNHKHDKGGDCNTRQSHEAVSQPVANEQMRQKSASN